MKLGEKQLNIFEAIKTVNPTLKMWDYLDAETIDLYYNNMYTECTLSVIAIKGSIESLAKMLNAFYGKEWDERLDAYENALKNLVTFGTLENRTETRETKGDNGSTNTDSVTGFNEDEFTNESKTESTGNHNENETVKKEITRGNVRYLQTVWNFLLQNNFISSIIKDVNSVLTLSIYEKENNE